MKILFVTSYMGFGGTERVISVIASELSRRGHQVGIYMTNAICDCVYQLHEDVTLHHEDKRGNMLNVLLNLRKFTKKYDPDIVIPFMTYQCIYTCIALMFSKYPVVVCERNDPNKIAGSDAGKLHFIVRDMAFASALGAVFQTEGARDCFSHSIQKKSAVILNPINTNFFAEINKGIEQNKIVNVGRLTEQKNQSMLIRAFSKIKDEYSDLIVEIYGDGEKREELLSLAAELGVSDRVYLMGNANDLNERIKDAKVFAFTSDYEGMPNALAEAMSIGLACVSTDCSPGGARMLIRDGINGILCPCNDVDAFAQALRCVLSDDQYRKKLSENAVLIRQTLSVSNIADQWEEYLKSLVK